MTLPSRGEREPASSLALSIELRSGEGLRLKDTCRSPLCARAGVGGKRALKAPGSSRDSCRPLGRVREARRPE